MARVQNRRHRQHRSAVWLFGTWMFFVLHFLCADVWAAPQGNAPLQILFIPSYNYDYPGIQRFETGMREGFAAQKDLKVVFSIENLQLADHPNDKDYLLHMSEALKFKFEHIKPDLIIAQYKQAAQFLLLYGEHIFGRAVPVIFAGIESEDYRNVKLPANFTGVASTYNIRRNIDLILQLHPKTKTVYVVAGVSSNVVNDAIKEAENYKDTLKTVILNTLPYDVLMEEIAGIQGDAAIIYTAMQVDVTGKRFVPAAVAREIARRAKVPAYGMLDTYADSGMMGGFLIDSKSLGHRASVIGGGILRGDRRPDGMIAYEALGTYSFNWNELVRWQVPEAQLPLGSVVHSKRLTLWEQYKWEISGAMFLIVFQGFLIIGLLVNRTKRKKAEKILREAEKVLRESEEKYRTVMEQSYDAIAVVEIETRRFLLVNQRWCDLLGYSQEEARNLTVYDVVRKPREALDEDYATLFQQGRLSGKLGTFKRKNGSLVEVERTGAVITFAGEKAFMFASRDMTKERKLQMLLAQDLKLAAEVQGGLVPQGFADTLVTVRTVYVPHHLVSGDYIDYVWNPEHNRFSGFVLDVSGHGVTSSLQSIAVSTFLRDALQSQLSLTAKLHWVNQQAMKYFTDDTYAAAICFEFDFTRQTLSFATAGVYGFMSHSAVLPPVVKKAGSLIGISAQPEYTEWSVPFQTGETFYFMSDGIFEQLDSLSSCPVEAFDDMTELLLQVAKRQNRNDDCSAICVQVCGNQQFPFRMSMDRSADYKRARVRLRDLFRQIAGEESGRIGVAVGEALNNAARESMNVRVKVNCFGSRLVVRIRDNGMGFDGQARVAGLMDAEPDNSFERQLYAEGGRGIMIMVAWMDRVRYNRRGNEVMLVKRIGR